MRQLAMAMALGASMVLGACGDDSGPGGDLDEQEQAALIQALAAEGMVAPFATIPFGPMLGEAEVGSMGEFSAIASQVKITLVSDGQDDEIFTYTGVTGWRGLDAGTGSIDEAITVYATSLGGTFPATVDAEIPGDAAAAIYFDGTTDSHYGPGTGGVFLLTGSSFGGTSDCPSLPASIAPIVLVSCRFATGTMSGSFDFTADRIDGTGPATHTQANTSYSLPAVQLSITLDYSDAALARGGS